ILGLSPETAKEWQRAVEAEFALWASKKENCDATGVNNFEGMQQLALKAWLMSGDVFPMIKRVNPKPTNPYSLRLHLIEADRVSTPIDYGSTITPSPRFTDGKSHKTGNKIYDGVEVDNNGMIVAYYIRNTYPGQITGDQTVWTRVEAYGKNTGLPNILHIMDSERCDQYRGVSYLAQAIEPLLQLRRYTESELMAALVQSFFTAWVKTKSDPTEIPTNEAGGNDIVGVPGEEPDNLSDSPNEYEMGPGTVLHLEDDEEVVFGNPNVPTSGFESFVKTICKLVGANLEIPYDVLIKEYNSSYSASRAALQDAWEAFRMRRKWFVDDFCQPVYETWLAEAVALGRIKAPGFFNDPRVRAAWCGARWIGPVQGQLDPLKEAKAAVLLADNGFKTRSQLTQEMGGGDWEQNVVQLKQENEQLAAAGGGRSTVSLNADSKDEEDDEDAKANE
ncbi:MAG TPA: phage portal protein, partial [Clostridia bacterium]|nr:phage portal protein [Clostridia bacterium]